MAKSTNATPPAGCGRGFGGALVTVSSSRVVGIFVYTVIVHLGTDLQLVPHRKAYATILGHSVFIVEPYLRYICHSRSREVWRCFQIFAQAAKLDLISAIVVKLS